MPGEGTIEANFDHEAWFEYDGHPLYVQRTILFQPDSVSFPKKYRSNLPCFIQIDQRFKRGEEKGKLMYPDLYMLREHHILTKKLQKIQARKCEGWVIPIRQLEHHPVDAEYVRR